MQAEQLDLERSVVAELRAGVRGRVITPADGEYDAARAVYFTATDRRPGAVVRAADASDVARVIGIAGAAGVELAVRNGGHSMAGHGVIEGGVVLDLRDLNGLAIDAGRRIARAGAGVLAGDYTKAAGVHGLATGFGDAPSVAVAGITLCGGVGFLHRKLGMTIDSLNAAEVVLADGSIVRASDDADADLFWAIRGGGGNFGVVTQLEYRLHEVSSVLAGMLLLPATPQRLVQLLEIAGAAPDALSLIAAVMPAPPMPMIPPALHGTMVLMIHLVYAGSPADGERVLAPIRALAEPLLDAVRPLRYADVYDGEAAPHPAAVAICSRFIDDLDAAQAADLFDALRAADAPMRVAQFRPLGGAVADVPVDATAYAHRDRRFIVNIAAMHEGGESASAHALWAASTAGALGNGAPGAYVGFLGGDGPARIREAYPGRTYERLQRLKQRYDPANLFRNNQNIEPMA